MLSFVLNSHNYMYSAQINGCQRLKRVGWEGSGYGYKTEI